MILRNTSQAFRLAPCGDEVASELYALARVVRSQVIALEGDPETEWSDLIRRVFEHFKQDVGPFKIMYVDLD